MDFMSLLEKTWNFVNNPWFVGLRWFVYPEEIGGYRDPHYIDGHTYNPGDGKWYKSPPAPDYGQWAWLLPASSEKMHP